MNSEAQNATGMPEKQDQVGGPGALSQVPLLLSPQLALSWLTDPAFFASFYYFSDFISFQEVTMGIFKN